MHTQKPIVETWCPTFTGLRVLLVFIITHCHSIVIDSTLYIDPSTFINYVFGGESNEYDSEFNDTKWTGHHALNETISKSNLCKSVNTFASRWLNADTAYFQLVPEDPNRKGYADLSWFNDSNNIKLVLNGYPQYLQEYGEDHDDLIYCLSGKSWPSYMLNNSDPAYILPTNLDAATELITSSLNVIYKQTGHLPKYFEPSNEPNNDPGDVPNIEKMKYEQYAMDKVSKLFASKGMIVGGPVISEISWFDIDGDTNTFLWNNTFKYLIENDIGNTLQFISWHQFSNFKQKSHDKEWVPDFYGSGSVHSTFDLIESYTNFVNGKPTKILISEHGLAAKEEMETGDFNVSYMQYIGAQTHLTDVLNFLDRPESQIKSNSFLLTSNDTNGYREPIMIIYPQNDTLTPTSIVYDIWKLLKQNGGKKVNSSINFNNTGYNKTENIKLHSYCNHQTNKLIIIVKEITWNDTIINIIINGFDNDKINDNYTFKALRVYWDANKAQFIRINVTLNSLNDIYLFGGETMVIHDIDYKKNGQNIIDIYRKRYYLSNFEILNVAKNVNGYLMNISIDNNDAIYDGVLRIGLNWNASETNAINIEPTNVRMDNNILPISLKRIDNLVMKKIRRWTSFEYKISDDVMGKNDEHDISIQFESKIPSAYITSIVAEIYSKKSYKSKK